MARAAAKRSVIDTTIYPTDDGMGEGTLQRFISEVLRAQLVRLFALRKKKNFVGANQFIYWVQHRPTTNVAPDVYVLPGVKQSTEITSWKVWETNITPTFVLEVVSRDLDKDYEQSPRNYAALGVDELVIFDPKYRDGADRVRWQVYRNLKTRGFVRVLATNADRVRSKSLACWLRAVDSGADERIRVAEDPHGDVLLPTAEESEAMAQQQAAQAQQQAAQAQQQATQAQQQAAQAQQQVAEQQARASRAEALVAAERAARERLEAELAALKRRAGTAGVVGKRTPRRPSKA